MANQPKKYKKFVATAATATLVASAIVPVASAASLTDVAGNTHEAAINALVDAGVINGYADGTFKPNKTLTRSDVVKLLGKYLVAEGYEVPTDYKTNPRFSDLSSSSNEELLKYAAVVADNGVFSGSNGKLLAGDNITRENMAIVLVRMVNTLNGINLEEYVASQKFDKEVTDLNAAKAEARSAIEVLDFYDITTAKVFNPKGSTTRGQFATFLNNTINADFAGVATTGSVKAINATTVEVTFGEEVADVKALDFAIKGLDISNAVVKQTDKKTVVLTTSAQTAGVEYVVTVNEKEVGKFTGISAVVPTKVELVSSSVQGKLGQQVTVKAQVTVAEGASKAGIPVTLFVPGSSNGLKAPITVEAVTDENGVATHTYTRYAATNDAVTVYATGDRSKFATGYVFWGVDTILSVEEVTTGSSVNNGGNKTYKVTYKDPETGKVVPNKTLNVSFLENINVPINKISKAKVNGTNPTQLVNGNAAEAAQIVTDSKGEALFTVTGENTEVTPVIFDAEYVAGTRTHSEIYEASLLQTTAPKVKFAAVQSEYTIELKRDGGEEAATKATNGREYNVVVKDKAGNVAKNETVNIAFNEDLDGVISTQTAAYFIDEDSDGNQFNTGKKTFTVVTDSKGEASFIIGSDSNKDYATPIAWIDVNSSFAEEGKLDQGESSIVGAISYFTDAKLTSGTLVGKNDATNKKATDYKSTETAKFEFSLANQSGKPISLTDAGYSSIDGNFTVYNDGAEVVIVTANGTDYKVSPNRSVTVSVSGVTPTIYVKPATDKTTSVKVTASGVAKDSSGKNRAFTIPTTSEVVAKFTSTSAIANVHTANLVSFNSDANTMTFEGKSAIKYAGVTGKTFTYKNTAGNTITLDAFEAELAAIALAGTSTARVTYDATTDNIVISIISTPTGKLVDTVKVVPDPTVTGTLVFDAASYDASVAGTSAILTLGDADLNVNKVQIDTATVALKDSANKTLNLTLVETGVNTGVFTTVLVEGTLKTLAAGTITATYVDAKNAAGVEQSIPATATLKTASGVLSAGTFTQAIATSGATSAEYTTKSIDPDYTYASGEGFTLDIDAAGPQLIDLDGKKGAAEVAAAINAEFAGTATVSGNSVVIKSTTTGTGSTVVVTLSNIKEVLNASKTGTAAVTTAEKAKYEFTITTALAAGEKLVIDGVEFTFTSTTNTAQATELATKTHSLYDITADGAGKVTLTAKAAAGTAITEPVVKIK